LPHNRTDHGEPCRVHKDVNPAHGLEAATWESAIEQPKKSKDGVSMSRIHSSQVANLSLDPVGVALRESTEIQL
jgi:hypothetical protein